jgi:hypothetical protein
MSRDITVNIQRAGGTTHVYSNVAMQLDTMSQTESAYYGGTAPYRRFTDLSWQTWISDMRISLLMCGM